MRIITVYDRNTEKAAERARLRRYAVFYVGFFISLVAVEVLFYIFSDSFIPRIIGIVGFLLLAAVLIRTVVFLMFLKGRELRKEYAEKRKITVMDFGTKYISHISLPVPEGLFGEELQKLADETKKEDFDRLEYKKIRAVREDSDYLYIYYSVWQQPLLIRTTNDSINEARMKLV